MYDEFEELMEPLSEDEILATCLPEAKPDEIVESMETKALCCVDHLCGCK